MFAGVYNEYIIKKVGSDVDIMIQNVFMYIDSIGCNVVVLLFQRLSDDKSENSDLFSIESLRVRKIIRLLDKKSQFKKF